MTEASKAHLDIEGFYMLTSSSLLELEVVLKAFLYKGRENHQAPYINFKSGFKYPIIHGAGKIKSTKNCTLISLVAFE